MTPQKPPQKPTAAAPPPAEPLQPHEIEMKRKAVLLAKVRVQRASLLDSLTQIDGMDPAKHYAWVNRSEARVNTFAGMGYVICTDPKVKTRWRNDEGKHIRGDMILMEIARDYKEAWNYDAELRAVEDLEHSRDSFKAFGERNGVPVEEHT